MRAFSVAVTPARLHRRCARELPRSGNVVQREVLHAAALPQPETIEEKSGKIWRP